MEFSVEQLKQSGFEAACNSAFAVSVFGQSTSAYTFTLTTLTPRPAPSGFEQFSLLFAGPPEPVLPQGTYRFLHPSLGELALFMVPVGKSVKSAQYEVCISRSTGKD